MYLVVCAWENDEKGAQIWSQIEHDSVMLWLNTSGMTISAAKKAKTQP